MTPPVPRPAPPAARALPPQRRRPAPPPGLDVSVCRDPGVFAGLAREWDRLRRACPEATAFQSHAWLHSWWLSYGRPRRLRLVLVRAAGELVGAAALMRTRGPFPGVVALGGAITDYTDVLIADGPDAERDAVAAALAAGIRRAARGGLVDLREVRGGAAAERVHAVWRGPKRRLADSMCLELPGLPLDGLIARVGSKRGQKIRAALRHIDAAGVREVEAAPEAVPAAVATLLRLHRLQWQGRRMTPEHGRARFAEHLARAGREMAAAGDAVVTEFHIGGRAVAANFTVLSPHMAGGYLVGAHPDLRSARIDVTALVLRHGVRLAYGLGRPTLGLLRGAEPHKFHWRPEHRPNHRLLLAGRRGAPAFLLRRTGIALRRAAAASPRLRALRERLLARSAP